MNALEIANVSAALRDVRAACAKMEDRAEESDALRRDLLAADAYAVLLRVRGVLSAAVQLHELVEFAEKTMQAEWRERLRKAPKRRAAR